MQWLSRLYTFQTTDEIAQRRGRVVVSFGLALIGLAVFAIPSVFTTQVNPVPSLITLASAALIGIVAILLARRGKPEIAAWIIVILTMAAITYPTLQRDQYTSSFVYFALSIIMASITLRPWHIWIALVLAFICNSITLAVVKPDMDAPYMAQTVNNSYLMLFMTALITFIGARVYDSVFRESIAIRTQLEDKRRQMQELNASLESQVSERTSDLQSVLAKVQHQADSQSKLLAELESQREVIREMSVPVLPVGPKTLVLPLVGALDTMRLQTVQEHALHSIQSSNARHLVIDVTGVPVVDTQVAQGLIRVVQSARLLGAETTIVGIRPEVAQTIVGLGLTLEGVRTSSTLRESLYTTL